MLVISWKRWPVLAVAGGILLALGACASNSARAPVQTGTKASVAEKENSRYGTLLRMASSTRASGDPAAAVQLYQQAIAIEGGRPEAYLLLGDTLIEVGAYDDAAKVFERALKRDSASAAAHRGYARALVGLDRPEMAIVHYQAVVEQEPADVQAHNGLGVAYDLAGQHEAAQAAYRAGLEIAPDSLLLRNNLGLSLALAGQNAEAIALLRQVVSEPGAKARHRQNLALAYGLAGDLAAAEQISRIDLDEEAVENNVAYFAALAAVEDRRGRAAAIGAHAPEMSDDSADAGANRRLMALALDGDGLELGLSPSGRWFVNLGDYASDQQASQAWRELRARHDSLLGSFTRLAGVQDGPQPLLVGPLDDAARAQSLCENLKGLGHACRPLAL
jgi:Flp pilus assembly protein TadD